MKTMTNQSGVTDLPPERSARVVEEFEQPRYSRRDTLLTMFGVLMVMLLGSLDQTIVATALPHVIADLHGFNQYTWVSTAYLLTSTVTVPIYGKLSDLFGRKPIFLFGIVLFLVGSALSGASQSVTQSIVYRVAACVVAGTVALLLVFTFAGSQYAWLSPQIIGLLGGSLVIGAAFVIYEAWLERCDGQPIIAPSLFKNSIFAVSTLVTF